MKMTLKQAVIEVIQEEALVFGLVMGSLDLLLETLPVFLIIGGLIGFYANSINTSETRTEETQ